MDRGYIRQDRIGMTVADQERALADAGVVATGDYESVYVDRLHAVGRRAKRLEVGDLAQRETCIADVCAGTRVVVASLDRIGLSSDDIVDAVERLFRKGVAVHDVAAGVTLGPDTSAADVLAAVAAAAKRLKGQRVAPAKAELVRRRQAGLKTGPVSLIDRLPPEKRDEMWRDWRENLHLSQALLKRKWGISPNTMRTAFGARGAPRGRKPRSAYSREPD